MADFDQVNFQQILRNENEKADSLVKLASSLTMDLDKAIDFRQL